MAVALKELKRFIPFSRKSKGELKQEPRRPARELSGPRDSFGSFPVAGVIFDKRPPEQVYDESYALRNKIP